MISINLKIPNDEDSAINYCYSKPLLHNLIGVSSVGHHKNKTKSCSQNSYWCSYKIRQGRYCRICSAVSSFV